MTNREFKVGDKVQVIADTCSHGYSICNVLTIDAHCVDGFEHFCFVEEGDVSIHENDLQLFTPNQPPKDRLQITTDFIQSIWVEDRQSAESFAKLLLNQIEG